MIAVIRLHGKFSLSPDIRTTLSCLKLNRLYACALVPENPSTKGMLQSCKDVVSFGTVDEGTVAMLLERRGKGADGKRLTAEKAGKIAKEFVSSGKKLEELGASSVFFLSPPKGGFARRKSASPFGPLGKNPEISELISKMA